MYIYICQQATIFTATLLFQPQLITTMYIQLHIINHQFVVLHTCTRTLFQTRHIREMQEIFRRAHNIKIQYLIEPFLIRSVRCKRDHVWWLFLSRPLILSRLIIAFKHLKCKPLLHRFGHPTPQQDVLSSLCRWICVVLNGPPPVFALFCLQLALWRNRDVGPKRIYYGDFGILWTLTVWITVLLLLYVNEQHEEFQNISFCVLNIVMQVWKDE